MSGFEETTMQEEDQEEAEKKQRLLVIEEKLKGNIFYAFDESYQKLLDTTNLIGKVFKTKSNRALTTKELEKLLDNINYIISKLLNFNKYNDSQIKQKLILVKTNLEASEATMKNWEKITFIRENFSFVELKDLLDDYKKKVEMYKIYYNDTLRQYSTDHDIDAPDASEVNVAFYMYCHGHVIYDKDIGYFIFKPPRGITIPIKFTAAPLCDVFISTSMQDISISKIIKIITDHYKVLEKNIQDQRTYLGLLSNYIIGLYGEYDEVSHKFKNIPESLLAKYPTLKSKLQTIYTTFDTVIDEDIKKKKWIYSHPISNPLVHKEINNLDEFVRSIKTNVDRREIIKNLNPGRISYYDSDSREERDKQELKEKIYTFDDDFENPISLDIKIYNTFKFKFDKDEWHTVVSGDSFAELLLKLDKNGTSERMGQIKEKYQIYKNELNGEEVPINSNEHDFSISVMSSKVEIALKYTITSVSLQFIIFFCGEIGINTMSFLDLSCGVPFTPKGNEYSDRSIELLKAAADSTQVDMTDSQAENFYGMGFQEIGEGLSQESSSGRLSPGLKMPGITQESNEELPSGPELPRLKRPHEQTYDIRKKPVIGGTRQKIIKFYIKTTQRVKSKNKNKTKNKIKHKTRRLLRERNNNKKNKSQRRRNK